MKENEDMQCETRLVNNIVNLKNIRQKVALSNSWKLKRKINRQSQSSVGRGPELKNENLEIRPRKQTPMKDGERAQLMKMMEFYNNQDLREESPDL